MNQITPTKPHQIAIRLSGRHKTLLENWAQEREQSVSEVIRDLIEGQGMVKEMEKMLNNRSEVDGQ